MEERLDYNEFAGMFGMWAELFKPFIEGEEMFKIYQRIKEDAKKEKIVPASDCTFRAFAKSNPNNIKSIWYLMDPYPRRYKNRVNQATGIAMDCSNSPDGLLQPSLDLFYDGIIADTGLEIDKCVSLDYLVEQGVLLLNTDLTCKLNKTSSHQGVWEPFQKFFLEEVMRGRKDIIYVLSGNNSLEMEQYINPLGNHIFKLEHPMAAGHRKTAWEHKNIFTKTNVILADRGKKPIMWDKKQWDYECEPPF